MSSKEQLLLYNFFYSFLLRSLSKTLFTYIGTITRVDDLVVSVPQKLVMTKIDSIYIYMIPILWLVTRFCCCQAVRLMWEGSNVRVVPYERNCQLFPSLLKGFVFIATRGCPCDFWSCHVSCIWVTTMGDLP